MSPWLTASVIARRATGSCTLLITCQLLDPTEFAASTVASGTALMPSATIFVVTGTANTTAAAIAVNRLVPNSARNGTRYTNGGIVCPASSTGRIQVSIRRFRPAHTPSTSPTATTTTVASNVDAKVTMLSCHTPVATSTPQHTAAGTAPRQPPRTAASATTTTVTSHHGEPVSSASSGLSRPFVTASRTPYVKPPKTSWIQVVTSDATAAIHEPMPTWDGNSAAHT